MALTDADRHQLADMATRADDPALTEALARAGATDKSRRLAAIKEGIASRVGVR